MANEMLIAYIVKNILVLIEKVFHGVRMSVLNCSSVLNQTLLENLVMKTKLWWGDASESQRQLPMKESS
jgi:hypothetical protein